MNLLMITRKVDKNDAQAGFTYGWVKKLGEKVDKLYVITWQKSNRGDLPKNIKIISLPNSKFLKFFALQFKALGILLKVDGVFCHMNPEYTILIAPYAKIFKKKIVTWYSHKAINWKVRLINILADKIITPTQEGFGLESKKKKVLGHGIDTDLFKPDFSKKLKNPHFQIISVGRISLIKNYETLIEAIYILLNKTKIEKKFKVLIIGMPGLASQQNYFNKLKKIIKEKRLEGIISFIGAIPNQELPKYYQESDLSINLCPTGSPDKAVLEAMACGLPVLAANETFRKNFGSHANKLIFKHENVQDLAKKIIDLAGSSQLKEISLYLREQVVKNHNLDKLVEKILNVFKNNH